MSEQALQNVLITGATGYIGRRLKERLMQREDVRVRIFVRNKNKVRKSSLDKVDVVQGDTFDFGSLRRALTGIDVAYYLIHSMGRSEDFATLDRRSAENFRQICKEQGVRRIIYLGGLGRKESASHHLISRMETGEILAADPDHVEVVWFRAGVVIGAGSASFEIIRNLVQKLPIMITPRWVNTLTQPIAVEDVLAYLEAALSINIDGSQQIDIGSTPMTFRAMMVEAAKVMGLKRKLIPVPFLSPALSSYWLILCTPVPYSVAAALVEGLKSETLVLDDKAAIIFPDIVPRPYKRAVGEAIGEIEQDQVISRWCDSSTGIACDIRDHDNTALAVLRDEKTVEFKDLDPSYVFKAVCRLGGEHGWFTYSFLWKIRGLIDKVVGGTGLNRGRRGREDLRLGDALDFWKVADIKENKRLLLLAQMKLPGKAWLEFDIQPGLLVQTAHFYPRGLLGRLYWYSVLPLHALVFTDLARKIILDAEQLAGLRSK